MSWLLYKGDPLSDVELDMVTPAGCLECGNLRKDIQPFCAHPEQDKQARRCQEPRPPAGGNFNPAVGAEALHILGTDGNIGTAGFCRAYDLGHTFDTIILERHCTLTSQAVDGFLKAKATFKSSYFIDAFVLSKELNSGGRMELEIKCLIKELELDLEGSREPWKVWIKEGQSDTCRDDCRRLPGRSEQEPRDQEGAYRA
ncbi:hypothetical protein P7K49_025095, partial [Saguinus oedipus]